MTIDNAKNYSDNVQLIVKQLNTVKQEKLTSLIINWVYVGIQQFIWSMPGVK